MKKKHLDTRWLAALDSRSFENQFDAAIKTAAENGRCHLWTAFEDFLTCAAISLSGAFDPNEERDAEYARVTRRYVGDHFDSLPLALACVVMALEENPRQDFLGRAFHRLELSNKWTGQFFTPYHLCELTARMIINQETTEAAISERGFLSILEPACGGGAMLIAARNVLSDQKANADAIYFEAVDIDRRAAMMCYIQSALLGLCAIVRVGNSLSAEYRERWITPALMLNPVLMNRVSRPKEITEPKAEISEPEPPAPSIVLPVQSSIFSLCETGDQ